jgi:hypothetical protein
LAEQAVKVHQHCETQGWWGTRTPAANGDGVKRIYFMVNHDPKDNLKLPDRLVLQQLAGKSGLDGRWDWVYGAKELPELARLISSDLWEAGFRLVGHRQQQVPLHPPTTPAPPLANRYQTALQKLLAGPFNSFSAAWINPDELLQIGAHRQRTVQGVPYVLPKALSHLASAPIVPPADRPFLFCALHGSEDMYVIAEGACA